jgi:hypothetical protein
MKYADLVSQKSQLPVEPTLTEDEGGSTVASDIGSFVGYLGATPKKGKKARKPIVIRRPK